MIDRKGWRAALAGVIFLFSGTLWGAEIAIEGGPVETGFNSGTFAYIHASVRGLTGQPKRYVVFAEIKYYGTTSATSVEMDRLPQSKPGVEEFQVGWPIPPQAPTGLYTLTLHVDDRIDHVPEVTKKVRGFVVYKKQVKILRVTLDKTIYNVGDPIKCEVGLENLSEIDMKGLRVEFSNANYPWISLFSQAGHENPDLALKVLRDHLDIAPGSSVTIPMMTSGTAAFLQGKQRDVMGSGISLPGGEKNPPPEIDMYTVALWNADRTKLYDMQFTAPAIVRAWNRDLPKPYSRDFTHPYNSFIDFAKYREFYAPGQISAALRVDPAHTLYRPGDTVKIAATLKNPEQEAWNGAALQARIMDSKGKEVYSGTLLGGIDLAPGATQKVAADAWAIPSSGAPGTYSVELTLAGSGAKTLAHTTTEIAVNELAASLMVICAHEDDEQAYAGLMRAAVEAGIPVEVLILTAGDVGECERYFDQPCGPNEAREFATVRMEESAEAVGHLGVPRDKFIDLGLPDGGSGKIWFEHKSSSDPFLSIYLAVDHSPYENVYKPNLPYARDAVVEAVGKVIAEFHPAMLALTGPDERHVDHRTANWFAIKACQALLKGKELDPQTVVLADQAYGSGGFKPAPYKYENYVVHLSGEAAALKQEMEWLYQSQDGNLSEGDKKALAELPREEKHLRIMDWQEHEGWNEEEMKR
ncbi:MAG: PIG-L family deacetylase [Terriglobia bacterium]